MAFKQVGKEEGIHGLEDVIFNLQYRHAMDVEQLLNYPNKMIL